MTNNLSDNKIELNKDDILCRTGDEKNDLYIIHSGKLLVCLQNGSQITPIAYLDKGQYIGELSFFDKRSRSANVICLEKTVLIKIPAQQLTSAFPSWLRSCAKNLTQRIRNLDDVINKKGLRRTNVDSIKPLSMSEQKYFFDLLKN